MSSFPIRVLLADEDVSVRETLLDVFVREGFDVVAVAADADEAIDAASLLGPDVAVVDVGMPSGGPPLVRQIIRNAEGCRVVALSGSDDRGTVLQVLLAGAVACAVKGEANSELVAAVRRAARRQASLSVEVLTGLMEEVLGELAERAHSEETLRRSEEMFRSLLQSAPDAVVIVNRDGEIVLVNEQAELMFGYHRDDLVGKPVEFLLPERFHRSHIEHRLRYGSDPRTRPMGIGLDLAGRRRNGTEFPADISLSTLETAEGTTLVTAFIRDISERERARIELRDLERQVRTDGERRELVANLVRAQEEERQRIAADVHDDTIQVMSAAAMRVHVLRAALTDPAQLALLTSLDETLQRAIARLRRLIFELRPRALDTDGLAAALETHLEEIRQDLTAEIGLDDRLDREPSSEVRVIVYRIALEAIANARKHARATHLEVRLEPQDGGVLLTVRDDGGGFTPDQMQGLPGHLGLPAMRERARMAGGWCRIESAPGSGCVVRAFVPDQLSEPTPDLDAVREPGDARRR